VSNDNDHLQLTEVKRVALTVDDVETREAERVEDGEDEGRVCSAGEEQEGLGWVGD